VRVIRFIDRIFGREPFKREGETTRMHVTTEIYHDNVVDVEIGELATGVVGMSVTTADGKVYIYEHVAGGPSEWRLVVENLSAMEHIFIGGSMTSFTIASMHPERCLMKVRKPKGVRVIRIIV
jgi:hypothetical protein